MSNKCSKILRPFVQGRDYAGFKGDELSQNFATRGAEADMLHPICSRSGDAPLQFLLRGRDYTLRMSCGATDLNDAGLRGRVEQEQISAPRLETT
jgi:hypothetical protein